MFPIRARQRRPRCSRRIVARMVGLMQGEILRSLRGLGRAPSQVPGDHPRRRDRAGAGRATAASSTRGSLGDSGRSGESGEQGSVMWVSTRPWWDCSGRRRGEHADEGA
uniref:Uncharacterized protein n=1 Tax=uncultured marine virus TaxID=186617 RepID=A0A0F7L561_9VIRU|nr:hypothetical protein [uncultured marine virus]